MCSSRVDTFHSGLAGSIKLKSELPLICRRICLSCFSCFYDLSAMVMVSNDIVVIIHKDINKICVGV